MPRPKQQKYSEFKIRFGKRVRELREQRNLTQEQLAELAEVSRDSIKNIEKGKHGPLFETLESLVLALECPPSALFEFPWPKRRK